MFAKACTSNASHLLFLHLVIIELTVAHLKISTHARVPIKIELERQVSRCIACLVVDHVLGNGQPICLIVLLMIDLSLQVLFHLGVDALHLTVRLRVICP